MPRLDLWEQLRYQGILIQRPNFTLLIMLRRIVRSSFIGALGLGIALGFSACAKLPSPELPDLPDLPKVPGLRKSKAPEATVDFQAHIKPVLEAKCLQCHNSAKAERGLNLETRETASKSWRGGPVIIAGEPDSSMLYQVLMLSRDNVTTREEAAPHQIRYQERKLIYDWIDEGAYWPDGEKLVPE